MKINMYAIWVNDRKWLGMMKRWQAYYLAFHVWVTLRGARNKSIITITQEDYAR